MSLRIIRNGILDTVQDLGRVGYRHLGINPAGAMDPFAASLANILVGNTMGEGVIEMHFPAAAIYFEAPAVMALTGADFGPACNEQACPLNTPLCIAAGTTLTLTHPHRGARCYFALAGGLDIPPWLGSASTHLKAHAGGWHGRKLLKGDIILFRKKVSPSPLHGNTFEIIGESVTIPDVTDEILLLKGHELEWLSDASRHTFTHSPFTIAVQSDRMGYHLKGPALHRQNEEELVSSPVAYGTIQLLPDGSLILLMADHQTTGGYPRLGTVISVHFSRIAQMKPGDTIGFQFTDIRTAEKLFFKQQQLLKEYQMQYAKHIHDFFEKNH